MIPELRGYFKEFMRNSRQHVPLHTTTAGVLVAFLANLASPKIIIRKISGNDRYSSVDFSRAVAQPTIKLTTPPLGDRLSARS
jgi:hypothetical protein